MNKERSPIVVVIIVIQCVAGEAVEIEATVGLKKSC